MQEHSSSTAASISLPGISEAKRRLLEMRLRGEVQQQPAASRSITPLPSNAVRQLSFAQERLWFLDQLTPGSAVFNVPLAVRLSGPIDSQALERGVNEIVRRHEALRTTFANVDGQAFPVSRPDLRVKLQLIDLTSLAEEEQRAAKAHTLLSAAAAAPFDLAAGPLIRTTLIKLDEERHVFLVVMHHVVSDGWSLVLFFQELSALYAAFTRGEASPLPELAVQYADYAAWQREWLQGNTLQTQINYWKNKLGGEVPVLELPADRPRPAVQTFSGARRWLTLPEPLTDALLALSQREGATLFMTMLAAFKVLLYRYTGQEDVIVGSPIANRPQSETESLIGFFLNNLALRSDLSGNPTFRETLARVRTTALEAYANQDVPFEKLIDALKPARDLSRTPIFQVYFNLFNFGAEIKLPGSDETVSFVEAWAQSDENLSKFDLTLYAGLQDRELKLAFVYNTDLFDAATVELMLTHFRALLEAVVAEPDERIANFPLTAAPQAQPESIRPTNSFVEFGKQEIEQSITDRFASQVERYAERVAIKTRNYEWTYRQLSTTVDRVAQEIVGTAGSLARNGSSNSTDGTEPIALLFEHDAPMIAGMLGALRAGKTYVPLDPHHPAERLAQIIEHCQATAILTNNKNLELARDLSRRVIWSAVAERSGGTALDEIDPPESKAPSPLRSASALESRPINIVNIDELGCDSAVELPCVKPDQLAYILYTSGSTGEPKGVMQNHRNVLHYIRVYTNNLHLSAADRLTLFSSYCFDASVMDIYGALLNGATLHPVDLKEHGLTGLPEKLIADQITVYHSTPTVYRYFVNELDGATRKFNFPKLRLAVLGGEKVTRADVESYQRHFADDCLFVNGLGPTEATVTLQNFIDKQTKITGESVPIGFPVENTDVVLLNKSGKPAEIAGEIAIKSEHVALGYWKNPEATARAFSTNGDGAHIRTYRTGDMGRRLPDGSIRFEGRKDFQIKLRGFRVELGEIEAALGSHVQVRECAVVALENNGETKLVAYVVPTTTAPSLSELRDFLKQKLPEYMVPGSFIVLDSLPLTRSGKLNRRALPAPERLELRKEDTRKLDPQTPLQALLVAIWSGLLGVSTIGIDDNFFELGGHSMLAVLLFAQIEKRLGKRLPLATLFQAPTVAQLAAVIQKDWSSEWSSLVAINPVERAQQNGLKPPFFCVHALGGNVLEYYDLARHLGADQPFYGLQSVGLDGSRPPHTRVEEMAAHYIKEMRELQPEGPYFIGGRSLGGMVAFEMAQQLKTQGEAIGLLALLDTYPSGYAKLFRNEATLRAALARASKRTKAHIANLQTLSVNDGLTYLMKKARFAPRKLKSQVWRRLYDAYETLGRSFEKLGRPLPRAFRDVKEFNSLAVRDYTPKVYDGEVTLFWASADLRTSIDLVEGWRALAGGGMEVHEIPGSHLDIIKEPHVGELATKLSSCLDRAQSY